MTDNLSLYLLIAAMSLVTMGSRLLGFLAIPYPEGKAGRALHYLPYGLFAAIVVAGAPDLTDVKPAIAFALGAVVTAIAAKRRLPLIAAIALGFIVAQGVSRIP